ncbi:MAG: hypothetical protein RBS13_08120 [Bacteroidales bacterium]|jgi:hypothetical protein|nr:hypothetical protein [Bacteroidales bacterium]
MDKYFRSKIQTICKEIEELLVVKNAKYGNSFETTRDKYGAIAYVLRLEDKLNRVFTLVNTNDDGKNTDESILDTIKDILGYTILELMYRTKYDDIEWEEMTSPEIKDLSAKQTLEILEVLSSSHEDLKNSYNDKTSTELKIKEKTSIQEEMDSYKNDCVQIDDTMYVTDAIEISSVSKIITPVIPIAISPTDSFKCSNSCKFYNRSSYHCDLFNVSLNGRKRCQRCLDASEESDNNVRRMVMMPN